MDEEVRKIRESQNGFTLIELMVVVVILMMIAAFAVPNFIDYIDDQKKVECQVNMRTLVLYLDNARVMDPGMTMEDLLTDSDRIKHIICPAEGEYSADGDDAVKCSHLTHGDSAALPEDMLEIYDKPITSPTLNDKYTITYIVNGKVFITEQYKDTRVLLTPPRADAGGGISFLGWYWNAGGETEPELYDEHRLLTGDLRLTAKFSEKFLITFIDTDGLRMKVVEVEPNASLSDQVVDADGTTGKKLAEELSEKLNPVLGREFDYWTLEDGAEAYDFTQPVITHIRLVPKMKDQAVVVFMTRGGTEISPRIANEDGKVEKPSDPTYKGYLFGGWYKDAAMELSFDFDQSLEGNFDEPIGSESVVVYLYAKWEPGETEYILNFWVEKANIEREYEDIDGETKYEDLEIGNYELVSTRIENAKTDSLVTISAADAQDPKYYEPTSGDAETKLETKRLLNYSVFQCTNIPEQKDPEEPGGMKISGTGETVINIYYTRQIYTLNFKFTAGIGGQVFLVNGAGEVYSNHSSEGKEINVLENGTYTIQYRYGEDVLEKWPSSVDLTKSYESSSVFLNWNGFFENKVTIAGFTAICVPFTCKTPMNYSGEGYLEGRTIRTVCDVNVTFGAGMYTERCHYYVEITEDELLAEGVDISQLERKGVTGDYALWYDRYANREKYFKLERIAGLNYHTSNPESSAKNWPGGAIDGYESIAADGSGNVYENQYYQEVFTQDDQESKATEPNGHYRINYFMPAKKYALTLILNGGEIRKEDLPEGYELSGLNVTRTMRYKESVILPKDEAIVRNKFEFDGWYIDEKYTSKYVVGTMPAKTVTLYAKFNGTEVQAVYYDGDKQIKTTQHARGDYFAAHPFGEESPYVVGKSVPGKGIFNGWYYNIGDAEQPAYIEFLIGLELLKDVYELVADWTPEIYTVTFMNADGQFENAEVSSRKNTLARSGYFEDSLVPVNRNGYKFIGWSTTKDAEQSNFNTGTAIMGNMEVYAIWKANTYTIEYDMNGGTGQVDSQRVAYNQLVILAKFEEDECTAPDGHDFMGWSKNKNTPIAKVEYASGAQVVNLSSADGGKITLYAIYKK